MPPIPVPDGAPVLAAFFTSYYAGDFFIAHEILEQFWVTYRGDDRDFYKGLIQAAVALHHASTGNATGAAGVAARARGFLAPFAPRYRSVDVDAVLAQIAAL